MSGRAGPCLCLALLPLLVTGCGRGKAPAPPAAEKPKVEADLAGIAISKTAYDKEKIKVQAPRIEVVQEHRSFTGWVIPAVGQEVTVVAPVGGYVTSAPDKAFPIPGEQVKPSRVLFQLDPIVSPLEMVQIALLKRSVEGEKKKAKDSVTVADSEVKRLRDLVEQGIRGKQELEQAEARLLHAQEDLAAAEDKLKHFRAAKDKGPIRLAALTIEAPRQGTIAEVLVGPGQYVAPATPLVKLVDLSEPWLRVQVPETELKLVDLKAPAQVLSRAPDGVKAKPWTAQPLALAPEVDTAKHTVTVFYSLKADKASLAKEQMVTVRVPLGEKATRTVVAYSAIVFDAYGGSWVYVKTKEKGDEVRFERRRVEVGASFGADVAVQPGLRKTDEVVVEGAGILFSREFHRPPVAQAKNADVDDD